ncbi:ARM repeat-containing protein [Panus rudis PR-1116 ss-1]|nr:ARM repeat-containing protein [Panus rudis PR-1116 ss-1]
MDAISPVAQAFAPVVEASSPSRDSASSIWAPQPQVTAPSWSRPAEVSADIDLSYCPTSGRPEPQRSSSYPSKSVEDVFGPLGSSDHLLRKDVGAIGDGRKKSVPEIDTRVILLLVMRGCGMLTSYYQHVEQLFRTLNLNSPAPPSMHPLAGEFTSLAASPDLSPVSTTSALLTPTDMSPAKSFYSKMAPPYDLQNGYNVSSSGLLFETGIPNRYYDGVNDGDYGSFQQYQPRVVQQNRHNNPPFFEPFREDASPVQFSKTFPTQPPSTGFRGDSAPLSSYLWGSQRAKFTSEWTKLEDQFRQDQELAFDPAPTPASVFRGYPEPPLQPISHAHEPINFLSLLHPSSTPPYHLFVSRIIKSSDQQASIFLQQKLKVADSEERSKIVDAICARGFEMMAHRFGNWAVQRCLEATATVDERRKIVSCMRGRVVDLATNCYGCHVLQKALDCEEDIRLLIVSELLLGDPAQTLVNKHASHVWSKIMELTWTPPAPPIFAYVNKSLRGKWASLACHETGSLVVQHAFENLEESAKDGIVDELLNRGPAVFSEVCKSQWGSYCVQHILEHGSPKHRNMTLDHLISGLSEFAVNEQGSKSITKALKEGGKETLDRIIKRMCEPAKGGRRAMIVDLALSVTGSQLIASVLPNADKDQRALLYDSIRGHIVTLRGCKTGSKVIWLFDRMRAYYGY